MQRPGFGRRLQDWCDQLIDIVLQRIDEDTGTGRCAGGLNDCTQRQRAQFTMYREYTFDHAGRGDRAEPDMELLLYSTEIGNDRKKIGCL